CRSAACTGATSPVFASRPVAKVFVIDIATRAVEIVGTTPDPNTLFMSQMANLLTDPVDGFLRAKKFLIMDRDPIFSTDFRKTLKEAGVKALRTPAHAPNCNALRGTMYPGSED